ncbi:MAG: prevent-host-death protein [Pseudomonadota bacterium]
MNVRIGVRELREKLSEHLESTMPIEVTRHGKTIGFYIPIPKEPTRSERDAMLEAGRRMREEMERLGITDDELMGDVNVRRKQRHAA